MKKVFKALAISAASVAMVAGIATATACSGGYNGTYYGEYHYLGYYGQEYGMVVEVSVENNIITAVKDLTNSDNEKAKDLQTYKDVVDGKEADEATYHEWHAVSDGWSNYFVNSGLQYWALYSAEEAGTTGDGKYIKIPATKDTPEHFELWDGKTIPSEEQTKASYGWSDSNESNWTTHISWLLNQYVGMAVSDVLDLNVYTNYGYAHVTGGSNYNTAVDKDAMGEPYGKDFNADLSGSGLLLTGATQGSGRLLLAVQNALLGK